MLDVAPPPFNLIDMADRLKALAEPKRLLILHLLMEGVHRTFKLARSLGRGGAVPAEVAGVSFPATGPVDHLSDIGIIDLGKVRRQARWTK